MKILHITKKYPNALGGDAVVVSNLEKQQKTHGHEVLILTSNCDEIKNGESIYKFGFKDTAAALDNITIKRLLSLMMLFFKTFNVLRSERPDLIHTHSVDMAFITSFAARFYKIPVVHTFHIVTFYDENQSALRRKTELLLARGAKPAIVTAPNTFDVKKLKRAGLNATLLPNGVDLNFWKSNASIEKHKVFTFLSVGRLEEQKGNEYLVKAASLLRQKTKTKFRVMFVGTGSLEQPLQNLAESLVIKDCIDFVGKKSPAEVREIYSTSNVAVFPSLYETTPLTLLEAWSMRVPTISTKVGILKGFNKIDTTLLVKPRNPVSLARAMAKVMSSVSIRNSLVNVSYQEVQGLAWSTINDTVEDIYKRITE